MAIDTFRTPFPPKHCWNLGTWTAWLEGDSFLSIGAYVQELVEFIRDVRSRVNNAGNQILEIMPTGFIGHDKFGKFENHVEDVMRPMVQDSLDMTKAVSHKQGDVPQFLSFRYTQFTTRCPDNEQFFPVIAARSAEHYERSLFQRI
jgi:hypothetical protein